MTAWQICDLYNWIYIGRSRLGNHLGGWWYIGISNYEMKVCSLHLAKYFTNLDFPEGDLPY